MIDNTVCANVLTNLNSDDFMRLEHQLLFDEMAGKWRKEENFDWVTLTSISADARFDLVKNVYTMQVLKHYIAIIKDLSTRRTFIRNLESLRLKALNTHNETETLAADLIDVSNALEVPQVEDDGSNDLINILDRVTTDFENQFRNNVEMYKKWGFEWLDKSTGGVKPSLTILAARPSVGKSAFVINLINNLGKQDLKIAFFGLEMANDDNVIRLLACNGKIQKSQMDDPRTITDNTWCSIAQTTGILSSYKIKMFDDLHDIDKILNKCLQIKNSTGLDFVAIDYLQLIEIQGKFGTNNDRIAAITRKLKKFQQANKIHLMLLSQFNRETEKQDLPKLSNLRDSGAIEQDADSVWALHQENMDVTYSATPEFVDLRLIILKRRGGKRNISKNLKFYGKTFQFLEN